MKTGAALPLLAGLAAAAKIPANVKLPATGVECKARPYNGPLVTNPDTPSAFKAYGPFNSAATVWAEDQNTPENYVTVPSFVNLNAAAQAPGYLSSIEPESYDPVECAAYCDKEPSCTSFNIFYERVPLIVHPTTLVPDAEICPGLSNSPSATLIKCAFYSNPLTAATATNNGQFQGQFETAVAGSTAFFKWDPPAVHGFHGPFHLGGATIHAPYGYLRHETFPGAQFDPERCAASCDEHFDHDKETGKVSNQCIFFNAYVLYKNGGEPLFNCAYYSEVWGPEEATNQGQVDGEGNVYSVGLSYAYYLEEQYYLPGTKDQVKNDI
ncbi:hypothetical protein B0T14DRAFT_421937 [Immersiella caudata]|uniref:Uncharacterized protein n=1 Tax=Immersiella caudata TaxID=314043 RepID=A0AA39X3Y8_9PEZI|nr:hypothetical protein B0T14DRAFT_421937 [Immersiella caudata]